MGNCDLEGPDQYSSDNMGLEMTLWPSKFEFKIEKSEKSQLWGAGSREPGGGLGSKFFFWDN